MKRILLIISVISILFLTGCNSNNSDYKDNIYENVNSQKQEELLNNGNQEIINTDVTSYETFDERISPYRDYISNTDFISNVDKTSGIVDAVHFVSEAKLEKINDKYKITLTVSEPIFFKSEEVQTMCSELELNDTAKLGDYTFYKDIGLLKASQNWSEAYRELIDSERTGMLATDNEGNLYLLFANTEKELEYKIAALYVAGAEGFVEMNPTKNIEIELYSDDIIAILPASLEEAENLEDVEELYELTVNEFYEKALNNEIENDSKASGFKYSLDNVGDSTGFYGEFVDVVYFENGKIIVRYKNDGV